MKFTNHAVQRLSERFPDLNEGIKSLFKKSVFFKLGKNEIFFLNLEHGIVFVVCKRSEDNKDQVRTVLTEKQLKYRQYDERCSLSKEQLNALAKECLETCNFCYPNKKKRKEISIEMRLKGIDEKDIKLFWDYMMDMNYHMHKVKN